MLQIKSLFQVGDPRNPNPALRPDGAGFPETVVQNGIRVLRRERRHRRGANQEKDLLARMRHMAKVCLCALVSFS